MNKRSVNIERNIWLNDSDQNKNNYTSNKIIYLMLIIFFIYIKFVKWLHSIFDEFILLLYYIYWNICIFYTQFRILKCSIHVRLSFQFFLRFPFYGMQISSIIFGQKKNDISVLYVIWPKWNFIWITLYPRCVRLRLMLHTIHKIKFMNIKYLFDWQTFEYLK